MQIKQILLSAIMLITTLSISAQFKKNSEYLIKSAKYAHMCMGVKGNKGSAVEMTSSEKLNKKIIWSLSGLSGSYRLISKENDLAVQATADGKLALVDNKRQ